MRNDNKNIPNSLKERRGERALITVWFSLIPLILAVYGFYRYFTMPEETIVTNANVIISACESCFLKNSASLEIYNIETNDKVKIKLSEKELNKYLELAPYSDENLKKRIDSLPAKNESWISLIEMQERRKRFYSIDKEIKDVTLGFLEKNLITLLVINGVVIRDNNLNGFWWSCLFLIVGIGWLGLHVKFFIRDPYGVYKELKDPFGKYKK